ncbi:fused response regulator/phosphatase [Kitasatospora sp. NBC_01287]|uniref:PP2C family protein-serine/threonine phosphatase n=1 Tax=Kitasatospora sp. NBC_01287 TaxID=2903573 RepID=UPI002257B213|nr:fused response regulator/phosphatase [Kitasatospora sp. NBC_01287]MCX4744628.1 fused response regulator/phosphatase [Kitasatospora sp. NBC_01287]
MTSSLRLPQAGPTLDGPYRILLLEDDAGDALLFEELLRDTGLQHTLQWQQTLAEAVAELTRRPADCVVVDLHLPDATGLAVLTAVQQACPQGAVIVLTGLGDTRAGVEAVSVGAQDYLIKGQVDGALLQRVLRYAVHRKQAEQAGAELRENRIRAQENARLERGLLPTPLLRDSAVTVTTRYLPGRERAQLGGDFLDAVQTADGVVHAVIGDVSGHGPDEAALGVCLRITWRALVLAGHRGTELLDLLEQVLVAERTRSDMFATCTLLDLDLAAARATVHLAGHHEPLLTAGRTAPAEAAHGIALGIAPGLRHWQASTVPLPATGSLMLYTDGLIEGHRGPGAERLGTEGLLDLIARTPDHDTAPFLDRLISAAQRLNAGRHADDLAILHLAWDGAGRPAP